MLFDRSIWSIDSPFAVNPGYASKIVHHGHAIACFRYFGCLADGNVPKTLVHVADPIRKKRRFANTAGSSNYKQVRSLIVLSPSLHVILPNIKDFHRYILMIAFSDVCLFILSKGLIDIRHIELSLR